MSDTCLIVFPPKLPVKWSVSEQQLGSTSTKCLVNILKVAAFTDSLWYGEICLPQHAVERHDVAPYVAHSKLKEK